MLGCFIIFGWVGSLSEINQEPGYWIKLESENMIDYTTNPYGNNISVIDSTDNSILEVAYNPYILNYDLSEGNNLISFPGENSTNTCQENDGECAVLNYDFESVLPDNLLEVLTGVIAEGEFAKLIDGEWSGTLPISGFDILK